MTLVLVQQPWGGYDWVYQRTEGELSEMERRYEERQRAARATNDDQEEPTTLAALIRQGLRRTTITHVQLAEQIGVQRSAVSNWTSGQKAPNHQNLQRICAVLGLDYPTAHGLSGKDPLRSAPDYTWNGGHRVERTG